MALEESPVLSIDGIPLSLENVRVGRYSDGYSSLGLLKFKATCPGQTDWEMIAIASELERRGYLVRVSRWKSNPFNKMFAIEGKSSFKVSARVNPDCTLYFKLGEFFLAVSGKAVDLVLIKSPEVETK